jgi:hypothetical protein
MTAITQHKGAIMETQTPAQPKDLIESLKARAADSKVFSAMAYAFAMRERTRQQVTVHNLKYSLGKEGYNFERDQFRKEIKFLASLGLGKLELDRKGRPAALKNIRYTLQSIGMAALSRTDKFKTFQPSPSFKPLPEPSFIDLSKPLPKEAARVKDRPVPLSADFQAYLTVVAEGKTMRMDIIPGLTTKDLLVLVSKIFAAKEAK